MILIDEEWKKALEDGISRNIPSEKWIENFKKREDFRKGISWHIPTKSLVDLIKKYSPIVSVGCGLGYTERLSEKEGADIILTDISPDSQNKWCITDDKYFSEGILRMDAKEAVMRFKDRNVFMAWPPYNNPMAYDVANTMEIGRYLVYVGESSGGCTGDDLFFNYLYENFEGVEEEVYIPSWDGIYDNAYIYKKIKG